MSAKVGNNYVEGDGDGVSAATPLRQAVQLRPGGTITQTLVLLPAGQDAVLAAADPNRRFLALINIDVGDANLGFGTAAVVDAGWPLNAAAAAGRQGGSQSFAGSGVPTNDVHGISASGTTIVVLKG
jgi:hypothetical protein